MWAVFYCHADRARKLKAVKFARISKSTVTEAIMSAMEEAGRIKHVVIIYETVEGEKATHGVVTDDDLTLADANFMLDVGKKWMVG
jgi:hypothetical protein